MTSPEVVSKTREYDLIAANQFRWVRGKQWFRIGLGTVLVVGLASVIWGDFEQAVAGQFNSTRLVGSILIYFVVGVMLYLIAAVRSPAVRLVLDDDCLRLVYRRGRPFSRKWVDSRTDIRGAWTPGVKDMI